MRLAVLGANGLLGSNVVATALARGHDVVGTYHATAPEVSVPLEHLDVTETRRLRQVLRDADPDAVVNCAAMTDVDACEENPEQAFAVNADAPRALARVCERGGIHLCHASTDYVFDGRADAPYGETDPPNPVQAYGASKLAGERGVREVTRSSLVARLSFVWGIHRSRNALTGFPRWVRDALLAGDAVPLFADQFVTPTRAGQAASVLVERLEAGASGVFNVACRSCVTPHEFGTRIRDRLEEPEGAVEESSVEAVERPAERPAYTCLNVDRIEAARGRSQPSLADDLDAVDGHVRG